ncbi:MAG: helix-turn-helix domain-containing protein [Woeseiaceae bacterium]|nr:helix-turn-helix domain-containing protein [Woeseiaceae bacterium]
MSVTNVACLLLERMANKFGGDCTLNELRVMNAVSVHSFSDGACSPTMLSRETGIPKSTVSRSLASLVSKGWLVEEKDTKDRRRRIIELSDAAKSQRSEDLQAIFNWINKSGH